MALLQLLPGEILSMTAAAADRLLSAANGDAALLYLWLLRHGGTLEPDRARHTLKWDEARLEDAHAALVKSGLAQGKVPAPEPAPAPAGPPEYTTADIAGELEDSQSPFPGLVQEVQRRLGKILSPADLKYLLTIYDYLALPAEVIFLLVNWCIEKHQQKYGEGQRPRMALIQKEAFLWKRDGVDTVEAADAYLKKQAFYRSREWHILQLLDQRPRPLVEKERQKVAAWTDAGFPDEVIRLAYEKTVYKKQGMDWNYMNGILMGWHRKNLHTLAEVEAADSAWRKAAQQQTAQSLPSAGEAEQRVRDDVERMREYMRRQRGQEGE